MYNVHVVVGLRETIIFHMEIDCTSVQYMFYNAPCVCVCVCAGDVFAAVHQGRAQLRAEETGPGTEEAARRAAEGEREVPADGGQVPEGTGGRANSEPLPAEMSRLSLQTPPLPSSSSENHGGAGAETRLASQVAAE